MSAVIVITASAGFVAHGWLIDSFPISELGQVMACRLFGAKPLHEPMLSYCWLDSWEQIAVKFE